MTDDIKAVLGTRYLSAMDDELRKLTAIHGDPFRLRKYGVPDEVIGAIHFSQLGDYTRRRATEEPRVHHKDHVARLNRFLSLPWWQRNALRGAL